MTNTNHSQQGFSLMELMISLAILIGISALIFVSFNSLNNRQSLDAQTDSVRAAIVQARTDALNSKNGADHSITFATTSMVYEGQSYNYASGITLSSFTTSSKTITFYRLTGFPSANGTLNFQLKKGNTIIATSSVSINTLGIVE